MADAADRTGKDMRDDRTGGRSPLMAPTDAQAPDVDPATGRSADTTRGERREPVPGAPTATGRDGARGAEGSPGGEGGFGGASTPGGDRASGFGREAGGFGRDSEPSGRETAQGRNTGSSAGADVHSASAHESRLLPHDECDKLGMRLQHAVAGFVDEPRSAVEEADHVLEEAAARFADAVKQRRRTLRSSWQTGDAGEGKATTAGDTEQLRLVLRDYRELTERLLHS
ncbi:hypothetical protein AB0D34_14540 [Streptomyces sp. NPDC048420]|uniref:hypothetical protein n=1 Tax=Streptomyces sp. NPDC048420 TaxID=3155755 RepID=UPI003427A560